MKSPDGLEWLNAVLGVLTVAAVVGLAFAFGAGVGERGVCMRLLDRSRTAGDSAFVADVCEEPK